MIGRGKKIADKVLIRAIDRWDPVKTARVVALLRKCDDAIDQCLMREHERKPALDRLRSIDTAILFLALED